MSFEKKSTITPYTSRNKQSLYNMIAFLIEALAYVYQTNCPRRVYVSNGLY